MTIPVLGRLETVPARLAWPDEARSFTPWLAANLDRLGEAVGLELELDATEVRVGPYRADIVAREAHDDMIVLIENQLETSDHSHLGQIQTYLTGVNAQRVIWVAPNFRPEHLSAIRWLNEHTVDPYAFFAVEVSVVRIGDSALAPLFKVLERPNDWDRTVTAKTETARAETALGAKRVAFWRHVTARHADLLEDGPPGGLSWRSRKLPDLGLSVGYFLGVDGPGVYVKGITGATQGDALARLEAKQDILEERIGAPIGSDYPFSHKYPADTSDPATWDASADWLHEEVARVAAILVDVFGQD